MINYTLDMKKTLLFFAIVFQIVPVIGQHDGHHQKYYPESDTLVLRKIEQWQDLKFGLLMHWGPYSQWGVVESWSICAEDEGWCRRNDSDYVSYKNDYEMLPATFNPVQFDPDRWASAAAYAGMRYVVFTTKHHDGFCMFDTKQTDYRITGPECPFATHPKADVTKEIFRAFRDKGFWTGAYFSKPDWHSEYYWWPNFATPDRNVNYTIARYPERWNRFIGFTHEQIMELVTGYGPLDILWLDGGWVAPLTREEVKEYINAPDYNYSRIQSQDIRLDSLVKRARAVQPGLIVVDRAVPGIHQNYLTPENQVPEEALPYPWESCIIAGGSWSWVPKATYMSGHKAVHLLVDIVAKGGNLLLNIAPGPEGQWHDGAYAMLREIGDWMQVNSEAIYGTRAMAPYRQGKIAYTAKQDTVYVFYMASPEEVLLPETIGVQGFVPASGSHIELLGSQTKLQWVKTEQGMKINIPKKIRSNPPCKEVWVFRVTRKE